MLTFNKFVFIFNDGIVIVSRIIAAIILMLSFPVSSYAEGGRENLKTKKQEKLYFQVSSYQYLEPDVMSKIAKLPFFGFGHVGLFDIGGSAVHFNFEGQYGTTHYNGAGSSGPDETLIFTANFDKAWQRHRFGFDAGFGYRILYDFWGHNTTSRGLATYNRQSEYFYASVGSFIRVKKDRLLKVKYKHLIKGRQTSYVGGRTGLGSLVKQQQEGFGVRVEYDLSPKSTAFADFWDISASDLDLQGRGFYEPANKTIQAGLKYSF